MFMPEFFFFAISTVEESSQPTKHGNKILVQIFLTVKAIVLDKHGINSVSKQMDHDSLGY